MWKITVLSLVLILVEKVYPEEIDINLKNFQPNNNNVFTHKYNFSAETSTIRITNINDNVGFFIIQIHSYKENITFSNSTIYSVHTSVSGTNIGLVWAEEADNATFYVFREWTNDFNIEVLIVVLLYDEFDPVPGACNLSFDNAIAPYQLISYNDEYISVKSQPPSAYGLSCDSNKADIEMYHFFLDEHDVSKAAYYEGIKKMLSVDDIRNYGKRVSKDDGYFKYNRLFNNYRGTGSVYGIIATFNNRSAAYVPAVSYGCDILDWKHSCIGSEHWDVLVAVQFIYGLFICFLGHRFFRFTLGIMGYICGVVITYCTIPVDEHGTLEATITSVAMGIFFGLFWIFMWWRYGLPLLSVHLPIGLSGGLLASAIFYAGLADLYLFTNNFNYWIIFVSIILVFLSIWLPFAMLGNIFACSFLGSYGYVAAMNYYTDGNLQYILINAYRRIKTTNFNHVIIDPPFQFSDKLHCGLWACFLLGGLLFQLREQRQKPPFPPNRYPVVITRVDVDETSPLLRPAANVLAPEYV